MTACVVGVDVGNETNGFHAVAFRDGRYADKLYTRNPAELAAWCRDTCRALVVAVDAPCRWSLVEGPRPAERELMRRGIFCFSSTTRAAALGHPANNYGWMFNGEALFKELEKTHPLCTALPSAGQRCCFETFPHAITWHLRNGNASAAAAQEQRGALLRAAGIRLDELTKLDFIDAALCALVAHHAATGQPLESYGESATGLIIVPAQRPTPKAEEVPRHGTAAEPKFQALEEVDVRLEQPEFPAGSIPPCPSMDRLAPVLARLVARTSYLAHPDVVRAVGRAVFPAIRSMRRRTQHVMRDGEAVGMYDDNYTPTVALLWSHGIAGGNRKGWTFAHIWSASDDLDAYTHPANVAMVPECLASLTDKEGPLTRYLRWHSQSVYGWKPADAPAVAKPEGYDVIVWRYLPPIPDPWSFIRQRLAEADNERVRVLRPLMQKTGRL